MDNAAQEKVIRALFGDFYSALQEAGILVLNTIKVFLDISSGELTISDEEESVSVDNVIYAWSVEETEAPDSEETKRQVSAEAREFLRRLTEAMMHEGYFEQQIFQTPFAVLYSDSLSDKPKTIYKADGGWTVMDKPLLKGWEKEMNGFLSKLIATGEKKPTQKTKQTNREEKAYEKL